MPEVEGSEIDGNLRLFGGIMPFSSRSEETGGGEVVSANPFAEDDWPILEGVLAHRLRLIRICSVVFGPLLAPSVPVVPDLEQPG